MRYHATARRRLAGGLSAVAILAAGLVGAGAAHADDVKVRLDAPSEVTIHPYVQGNLPQQRGSFFLQAYNPGPAITTDVTYTLDFSELAGVVDNLAFADELFDGENRFGYACTLSGMIATCGGDTPDLKPQENAITDVYMTPTAGSKEGDSGTVKITAKAPGLTFTSTKVKITVGGPKLATFGLSPSGDDITRTTPGDVYKAPLAFANVGTQAADKVLLEMEATAGLDYATRFSNCEYGQRTLTEGRPAGTVETEALCEFDQTVAPGTTADLGEQVHLVVNEHALADQFHAGFVPDTPAARAEARGSVHFTRGTGPALSLALSPTDPPDNIRPGTTLVNFQTAGTSADYVAKGGSATGAVGDVVKATVGFTNRGPAWVGNVRDDATGGAGTVWFTVPDGAEVVRAPAGCTGRNIPGETWDSGLTGAPLYACFPGMVANVGQAFSYTFKLKIVKAVTHTEGSVFVSGENGVADRTTAPDFDKTPANNGAAFVLSGKPGKGSGGSTSGSTTGSGSGSGSGGSGSGSGGSGSASGGAAAGGATTRGNSPTTEGGHGALALTGAEGLGVVGGAALIALGVGGGFWATARRRRARA